MIRAARLFYPRARARAARTGAVRTASAAILALALAGCSILGGGDREPTTIFAPDPRVTLDAATPAVDWQLSLVSPQAARIVDTSRIAVRPTPGELQVYRGASWAKPPPDMLTDALLRALEDSGRIPAVARQGSGIAADYKLVMDVRRFEADYAGKAAPAATIEFNAKLIHGPDQAIVASRTFLHAEPSAGTDIPLVADAFSRGMERLTAELAHWILSAGDTHQRSAHPGEAR